MKTRIELDSLGPVDVPAQALWGAQTQRSLRYFRISTEILPQDFVLALAEVKRACIQVNGALGRLPEAMVSALTQAADEVLAGQHASQFPLSVWQTGSGTQTHMNMNEVLANRASELMGGGRGSARCVHPNDHVNLGQSSNDIFPTAMHVAAHAALLRVVVSLEHLRDSLQIKVEAFADIIKVGRTHLQDATPLTLGQEFSGYVAQLDLARSVLLANAPALRELAVGGTAVGTGLNTHPEFGERVAAELSRRLGTEFCSAPNKFAALAGHEALAAAHGALKTLACTLMKIANDVRWLASGPRCGLGELSIPENEPGSSIMPGKVNPTQCEALTMLCCQVLGNDVALNIGAASGQFELNVYKPMMIHNFLQSARLLADGMTGFDTHLVQDMSARTVRIQQLLDQSLMLVTALTPHLGYDRAAQIAKRAHQEGCTLREAALALGDVTAAEFDLWVRPERMLRPD